MFWNEKISRCIAKIKQTNKKNQIIKRPVIKGKECNLISLLSLTLVLSFLESMFYLKN